MRRGPTQLHQDFRWYIEHGYSTTLKFQPAIGDRPVPDAQHVVLQVLSLVILITTTRAYLLNHREAPVRQRASVRPR